jgi:hypothetical protein
VIEQLRTDAAPTDPPIHHHLQVGSMPGAVESAAGQHQEARTRMARQPRHEPSRIVGHPVPRDVLLDLLKPWQLFGPPNEPAAFFEYSAM